MRIVKVVSAKARAARERNFTFRQLRAMWRGRMTYLQILRNFRELEGSWSGGIRKFMDVFTGGA
ncbi:MAG: hypothetical protein C4536_06845 [Actinobacteria bacterium]|jgi:hypothetical protein|nr:MAG: hypothetical protein C4536_06845 [Actinomycetota bacterium]